MMLYHREHPQEEMTTLDYIPSLHPLHPQVVGFVPVTHSMHEQEIAEAVAAERERCARIAEEKLSALGIHSSAARIHNCACRDIAAAIRNAK